MKDAIYSLEMLTRTRKAWLQAHSILTLQIKARERFYAGGKGKEVPAELEIIYRMEIAPMIAARQTLKAPLREIEKEIAQTAAGIPCAAWWCSHRGQNILGLATLVGACGDLSRFANPAKLWKWFGLHVDDGVAAKRVSGKQAGYAPWRRAVIKVIGNSIKMQGGETSPYRAIYDQRKAYETAKNEAGDYAEQAAKKLKRMTKGGDDISAAQKKCLEAGKLTPAHIDARAMRYMEKRLIRDLWCRWRDATAEVEFKQAA